MNPHRLAAEVGGIHFEQLWGSTEIDGYPVVWTVEGSGPKKLTMVIEREGIHRAAVADTFVTYLASWGS